MSILYFGLYVLTSIRGSTPQLQEGSSMYLHDRRCHIALKTLPPWCMATVPRSLRLLLRTHNLTATSVNTKTTPP
ncbi:hypothetical protein EDB87DRAFT_152521 [Lactarius vividus]|nr:hypothetical protein EDB87DRAFT_152521 [Lactarius vividus]